jgi:hypothetical protein
MERNESLALLPVPSARPSARGVNGYLEGNRVREAVGRVDRVVIGATGLHTDGCREVLAGHRPRQRVRHARALPGFRHPLTPDAASASVAATCTPRVTGADFTVAITCYRLQDAHVLEAPLAGAAALVAVASTTTKHFATTSQTFYGRSIDGPVTAHARSPPSSILLGSRARASRRTPSDAQRELVSRTRRRSLD